MLQLLYLESQRLKGFKLSIHKDQFCVPKSASESLELGEFVEPPAQFLISVTYTEYADWQMGSSKSIRASERQLQWLGLRYFKACNLWATTGYQKCQRIRPAPGCPFHHCLHQISLVNSMFYVSFTRRATKLAIKLVSHKTQTGASWEVAEAGSCGQKHSFVLIFDGFHIKEWPENPKVLWRVRRVRNVFRIRVP